MFSRMRDLVLSTVFIISFATIAQANELVCEHVEHRSDRVICIVTNYTAINSFDFIFSNQNNEVDEINLSYNRKVDFLPVSVYQKFPNLKFYQASRCSIHEISKKNFEQLIKLRELRLSRNQIEMIPSDAFQGLTQLEEVYLGSNNIKKIEAHAFDHLPALKQVWLDANQCIDQAFHGTKMSSLSRVIGDQCSDGKKYNPYATRTLALVPSHQATRRYVLRNNF